jgi:hypothetical protein
MLMMSNYVVAFVAAVAAVVVVVVVAYFDFSVSKTNFQSEEGSADKSCLLCLLAKSKHSQERILSLEASKLVASTITKRSKMLFDVLEHNHY